METLKMNYHLKLQEMCDCYLETDFLAELQHMAANQSADLDEDAIKYLSLAIMHTITEQAEKLSFKKKGDNIAVSVKNDEKINLPAPTYEVFGKITEIIRSILHIEEDKGETDLSLGLRSGDVTLGVKVKRGEDKETVKIKFPR